MPDEKTETTTQAVASTEDGSAPTLDNAEESLFENMTPEELRVELSNKDKSYKELHSKVGQMSGELGELRKIREKAEMDGKLASVLDVANQLVADKNKEPERNYEEWEAKIIEEAQENPAEALKKAMRAQSAWSAEDRKAIEDKYGSVISELKSQISGLAEKYETTTPDYQENKELIEKFRSKGMNVADAKAMAKEVRETLTPERTQPPQGVNPTRTVTPDKPAEKPWTDEDVQKWERQGESPEFIEKMKEKRERDAILTDEEKENF